MKWECHTEFVSYTLYDETGQTDTLFAGRLMDHLPEDWLDAATGDIIAAVQLELLRVPDQAAAEQMVAGPLAAFFNLESLAVSRVLDGNGIAMGDFRIHEGGFTRFALVLSDAQGPRRTGRICQRLLDIEVYRMMSMLALPIARKTARRLNEVERELTRVTQSVTGDAPGGPSDAELFTQLTALSAEIESLAASSAFRFGAGKAYETIVHERLEMLREARVAGRQLFREFMLRRFDPAMRTVHAAESRLTALSVRAARVAELLRTRVNVALEAQNKNLLESMDQRAALQLRLQQTVEGLSVVAISYYAVSLAGYLLAPMANAVGIDKTSATALAALPIIAGVWWFVRRIRNGIEKRG